MPSKKRRDLTTINTKGLRLHVLAAIAGLPELRLLTVTTALPWLARYALDILWRGRALTLPLLIARKFYDKRFPWGLLEGDPDAAMELLAEAADIPVDRLWLIVKGEASATEEDISGLASAFEMDADEVVEISEGRGPLINGEGGRVHAQHR